MTDAPSEDSGGSPPRAGKQGLSPGTRVAGYLIEERLGVGGMAMVYRAVDQRLDRRVALKILSPELAEDEAFRLRFIRESRAAAAVDDPHIIPVFEAGDADGVLFIAMRLVPGGDVHSLVRASGPLPPGRAALILSQVASALDAAHRHGLVHRDVKPANMLMDVSGGRDRPDHIYLSDFGLSKGAMSGSALTATGMFIGTLDYIAPEQLSGQAISGQTDQYALACSAFELLSGAPPFLRDAAMPMMWAHMSEQPPSLAARRPDLPARVDAVVGRALAKSPADRYGTCREFTDALRAALGLAPYESGGNPVPLTGHMPTEVALLPDPAAQPWPHAAAQAQPSVAPTHAAVTPPAVVTSPPTYPATAGWNAPPPPQPGLRGTRRSALIIAGAGIAVAAIAIAVIALLPGSPGGAPAAGRTSPVVGTTSPSATQSGTASASPSQSTSSRPSGGTSTFALSRSLPGKSVNGLAFSSLGTLAVAANGGLVHEWNPSTGVELATLATPGRHDVNAIAFSPNGGELAAGDSSGRVYLWNQSGRRLLAMFVDPGASQIEAVTFSPDGTVLAAGDLAGTTYLWNVATRKQVAALPDPNSQGANTLAFSPDGATLAAGDFNGTTYLWQVATAVITKTFPVPSGQGSTDVLGVAFSPDGSVLATGSYNGSTYLWNVATGNLLATLTDNTTNPTVEALAFSPDSSTLVTGDANGSTYVWRLSDDSQVQVLPSPRGVWAVGFSRNGSLLAIADHHGPTYIWQAG